MVLQTPEEDILEMPLDEYKTMLEMMLRNLNIKDFGISEIGGKKCLFAHYQGTMGEGLHLEQWQFLFLYKDKTFAITFSDLQSNFNENRLVFEQIRDSFQIQTDGGE